MQTKFKFKLEGLLKIRKFNEQKIKIELGVILKDIQKAKDRIGELNSFLDEGYKSQEGVATEATGKVMGFYPLYFNGIREDINNQYNYISIMEKKYQEKLTELTEARGKVKVLDNMKEKKQTEYKHALNKKKDALVEEMNLINKFQKEANS